MNEIKHILVITLSNIGDAVLTLPVLGALREEFKDALIDAVVGPRAREIFESDPRINKVYLYDKTAALTKKLKFLFVLRKNRYDLAIDLRNSLFGFFLGARFCNNPFVKLPKGIMHKIDTHLFRLKTLGLNTEPNSYPIWISQIDADYSANLLRQKGISDSDEIICVSPGAKSHIKRWSKENFARLCDKLAEIYKAKILLVGDSSDIEICEKAIDLMKRHAVSIAGKTNLRELAWCIKRARLLITNDSAPLHIAGSVGTPSVAIFGPTDYRKYGPRVGLGFPIYRKMHCSPCEKAQCRYNLECMKAIGADEVFEIAKDILDAKKHLRP